MKQEVTIPRMGANSDEATLWNWLKNVGDAVEENEPLAELETDKVNFILEAPAAGILTEILVEAGKVVPFGKTVAILEVAGEGEQR